VIAALPRGEKRWCSAPRALVEELSAALRERMFTTFLSHAIPVADERRRAELGVRRGQGPVIVSTSTLELGIDVGDLIG